jgi:N-acetyl-anhydromuramyl-L-alanine amidase AmpD
MTRAGESASPVTRTVPARYHGDVRRMTTHVVWHATAGASADSSLGWMNRPNARETGGVASYHYLIERDGTVIAHAPITHIAFHAGVSAWPQPDGPALNHRSVGIAFCNRQVGPTHPSFERITEAQIRTARELLRWLVVAHGYDALRDPHAHLRHADVSPTRRADITPQTLDWAAFVRTIVAPFAPWAVCP